VAVSKVEPQGVITWERGPAVALSFWVNFGMFAGRDVSRLEIERLSAHLLSVVDNIAITAEHRSEFGQGTSVDLHQVRIDVDYALLPPDCADIEALRTQIAARLETWLRDCQTGFSGQEFTHAEVQARDAVVEGVLSDETS
jgi:hypothetical protein